MRAYVYLAIASLTSEEGLFESFEVTVEPGEILNSRVQAVISVQQLAGHRLYFWREAVRQKILHAHLNVFKKKGQVRCNLEQTLSPDLEKVIAAFAKNLNIIIHQFECKSSATTYLIRTESLFSKAIGAVYALTNR